VAVAYFRVKELLARIVILRALMGLLMVVLIGRRERTELEFRSLLQEAKSSLTRVISTLESLPV
jgi:hypothetical protein